MYTENEYGERQFSLRKLLLKILLIAVVIILLIFLVPKFLSYEKKESRKKSTVEVATSTEIKKSSLEKLENAGLKYFTEENIPTEVNDSKKVTLKQLKTGKLIDNLKNENKICDEEKSYVELIKTADDYTLKTVVVSGKSKDYKLLHVGKYDYCDNTVLCEKDSEQSEILNPNLNKEDKKDNKKELPKENTDTTIKDNSPKLSEFTKWQEYKRTSCDTQAITCNNDDTNCLREVKLFKRTEIVGTKTTTYKTEHTALRLISTENKTVCSDYNYLVINNVIFRTKGNYGEILNLNKKTTSSWTYKGQISTEQSPRFGANEYYKYVGADTNNNKTLFYYDSYKYNYSMERVTSYTTGCTNKTNKQVSIYSVYKQPESYNKTENVYLTACYASERTRSYN